VANVGVHRCDEVIVRNLTVSLRRHDLHKIIDLIVLEPDLQRVETFTKLSLADHSVTICVKDLERFLKVEVLDEESSCDLVEDFIQTHLAEVYGVKATTEVCQVNLAD
jgi:hypothetical protein